MILKHFLSNTFLLLLLARIFWDFETLALLDLPTIPWQLPELHSFGRFSSRIISTNPATVSNAWFSWPLVKFFRKNAEIHMSARKTVHRRQKPVVTMMQIFPKCRPPRVQDWPCLFLKDTFRLKMKDQTVGSILLLWTLS